MAIEFALTLAMALAAGVWLLGFALNARSLATSKTPSFRGARFRLVGFGALLLASALFIANLDLPQGAQTTKWVAALVAALTGIVLVLLGATVRSKRTS